MGRAKKGKITKAASEARCYGLMVGDVTDIQVKEQNIIFIQYIQNTQVQIRFWPSTISQSQAAMAKKGFSVTKTIRNTYEGDDL